METGKPPQGVGHKKHPYADVLDMIGWHLDGANEELLGLHRYKILTYDQYTDVANLLVDAREKLKGYIQAGTRPEAVFGVR